MTIGALSARSAGVFDAREVPEATSTSKERFFVAFRLKHQPKNRQAAHPVGLPLWDVVKMVDAAVLTWDRGS